MMHERGLGRLAAWAGDVAAFVLPQRCPGCGAAASPARLLCDGCRAAIPRVSFALCARCLARGQAPSSCKAHPGHAVWAAWLYDERAACVVHALKYHGRTSLAAGLAPELARAVPPTPRADLVLAMPLHPARRRERGYNQAQLLAHALATHIGVPCLDGALERVRHTQPQARLGPVARRANVAGAFRVRRPDWLERRSVLIVDDVMTTGVTLEACLEPLARAGAEAAGVALAWAQ